MKKYLAHIWLNDLRNRGQEPKIGDLFFLDTYDGDEWRIVISIEGDLITHCRHRGLCSPELGCELEDDGLMDCMGTVDINRCWTYLPAVLVSDILLRLETSLDQWDNIDKLENIHKLTDELKAIEQP